MVRFYLVVGMFLSLIVSVGAVQAPAGQNYKVFMPFLIREANAPVWLVQLKLGGEKTSGEVFLTPTEIYTLDCLALIKSMPEHLHAFSHITGGGIAENTARVIPDHLTATYDRSTWSLPVEMEFMAKMGGVPQADMERTWNCGIGMSAIVDPSVADLTVRSLLARGMKAWVAGVVSDREGSNPRSSLESTFKAR
mgnify:CR=1 FL=1